MNEHFFKAINIRVFLNKCAILKFCAESGNVEKKDARNSIVGALIILLIIYVGYGIVGALS